MAASAARTNSELESYEHYRTLFHGYPQYSAAASGPSIQLENWRTNLRALEAERSEIELHAHGLDIPQRMIDYATDTGARGSTLGRYPGNRAVADVPARGEHHAPAPARPDRR
ncbi:hypothetical protein [Nocardia sp. MW-W600-9]